MGHFLCNDGCVLARHDVFRLVMQMIWFSIGVFWLDVDAFWVIIHVLWVIMDVSWFSMDVFWVIMHEFLAHLVGALGLPYVIEGICHSATWCSGRAPG